MIEIGTHEFEINPKIGQPMGGYWRYNKFIKGIRDPVFGNILIISNKKLTHELVVLDELILDSQLVKEMKQEIEKRTKIPYKNITIHVNHTHSTSVTVPEPSDDDYPFLLPEAWDVHEMRKLTRERRETLVKIVSAASEIAFRQMNPVRVGYKEGYTEDIGRNRNRPLDGPVDNSVPVIRFLERLFDRNEYFIKSHHPLRETLINQTGNDVRARKSFLQQVDKQAIELLIHRWEPSFAFGEDE